MFSSMFLLKSLCWISDHQNWIQQQQLSYQMNLSSASTGARRAYCTEWKPLQLMYSLTSWTCHRDVLSVWGANGIGHVPSLPQCLFCSLPTFGAGGTSNNHILVVPDDGITVFMDEAVYDQLPHTGILGFLLWPDVLM